MYFINFLSFISGLNFLKKIVELRYPQPLPFHHLSDRPSVIIGYNKLMFEDYLTLLY